MSSFVIVSSGAGLSAYYDRHRIRIPMNFYIGITWAINAVSFL